MPPTRDHVRRAIHLMRHGAEFDYFFDHLSLASWIRPLADEGVFQSPPAPISTDEGVSFPNWAPARYLVRMAGEDPNLVMETLLAIPSTDNPVVNGHMIDASLNMPANVAARLVPRAKTWVRSPYHWLVPHKLGQLCAHIAATEPEAAVALLRALLVTQPGSEGDRVRPKPLFDAHEYEEIASGPALEVVGAAGLAGLDAALDALEAATRMWFGEPDRDWSHIVRPAISPDEDNLGSDALNPLVDLVRDGAKRLIDQGVSVTEVIERLDARAFPIFRRLALHILSQVPEAAPDRVREALVDPLVGNAPATHHEYLELLHSSFPVLDDDAKTLVLDVIRGGPTEASLSDEQAEYWKLQRYALIAEHLEGDDRAYFEARRDRYGPIEELTPAFRSRSWIGPTSPWTSGDLASMSVEEIVGLISKWEPSGKVFDDSSEGISRALSAAVKEDPKRFSTAADAFVGLPAAYRRGLVSGFRDAIKNDEELDWAPVLSLCNGLVAGDRDEEVRWARREVAHLIEQGMSDGPGQIPELLWDDAWALIEILARDTEPDPSYEAEYGGDNMDPYTLSINTVRGQAIHSAIAFGMAQYRRTQELGQAWELREEVSQLLESHLDPANDPSPAIKAVYGACLPQLQLIAPELMQRAVDQFMQGLTTPPQRAMWEAFLVFARPYRNVYELTSHLYAESATSSSETTWNWPRPPHEGLVAHLIAYYLWGVVDLSGDSPVRTLLDTGSVAARTELVEEFGRTLRNSEFPLQAAQRELCQALWEDRVAAAEIDRDRVLPELSQFGWWFSSEQLDNEWVLDQALRVLELGAPLDPNFVVMPRLADIAAQHPRKAVLVLRDLVDLEQDRWRLHAEREHIQRILGSARESDDSVAQAAAEEVVNRLAARGVETQS